MKITSLLLLLTLVLSNLSHDLAAGLLKEILALAKKNDKLVAGYVKKVAKATDPVVAMQFDQVEMYVMSEIRLALSEGLPFPETLK
jgi:uncharacterized protein YdaL